MMHLLSTDALDEAALQAMVANGAAEGRHLDFKLVLPGNSDRDKRELLADVTSFANAGGGVLLFGVAEAIDAKGKGNGTAGSLPGVTVSNQDQEQLRLEQVILAGTSPRVPGIRYAWVPMSSGDPVLAMRIPQSWSSPLMVDYKGTTRFYSRNSKGKYQLDVHELRAAFLISQGMRSRIVDFRRDRLAKIVAGETPIVMSGDGARFVLHLVPLGAFSDEGPRHFAESAAAGGTSWRPLAASGWNDRWNLDGILYYSGPTDGTRCRSYTQVFRGGAVEAALLIGGGPEGPLPSGGIEHLVVESVEGYARRLRDVGNEQPLVVQVSLVGVHGLRISGSHHGGFGEDSTFDRDVVCVPDEIIQAPDDALAALRRVVDTLWQAAGHPGTPFVQSDGSWIPGGEANRHRML